MNPYSTVFSDDNYYLLCYNDKYKNIIHYRVDRMDSVKMLNEDIVPLDEGKQFNVTQHKKELFGMFTGQEEDVRFVIDKSLLDVVFDRFGCDIKVKPCGEDKYTFTAQVQVSPIFIGWCCAFGKKVKIVSPDNVVEKLKKHLKEMGEQYE